MTDDTAAFTALVLDRYPAADLLAMFAEEGVVARIEERGFTGVTCAVDDSLGPLTHLRLFGDKHGSRHLLLDTCLTQVAIEPGSPYAICPSKVDLLVIYWLREQDPTAAFDATHLRLPLQQHPGLGVLRRAFRVAVRVAREMGKHGIAALPKFFHDAAIFYHSRLFLFLDPGEQGRFEALLRDLSALSLQDASMALAGSAVTDESGAIVSWQPGLQVMPLAPVLTDCFNGEAYQAACAAAYAGGKFTVDAAALAAAREVFEHSVRTAVAE